MVSDPLDLEPDRSAAPTDSAGCSARLLALLLVTACLALANQAASAA